MQTNSFKLQPTYFNDEGAPKGQALRDKASEKVAFLLQSFAQHNYATFPKMDTFTTISAPTDSEYKDKGSRFLGFAFPLQAHDDIKLHLEALRLAHNKARHWCYAWRMGVDKNDYRANDDGEPSGTAGRPILGQIDSAGLTNVLVVVVRYFGGVKLGTSGLITAYRAAAQQALAEAQTLEKRLTTTHLIDCDYTNLNTVLAKIRKAGGDIRSQDFAATTVQITVEIPLDDLQNLLDLLAEY